MECKELISLAAERKLNKKVRKDCFLSFDHYLRFKYAYYTSLNVKLVGNYVVFSMIPGPELKPRRRRLFIFPSHLRSSSSYYIAGIDDSGKIFCTSILYPYALSSEEDVRIALGFTHHYYEKFEYGEGISIRLQGDLVMDVLEVAENEDELIASVKWGKGEIWWDFVRSVLGKDKEVRKTEKLIDLYTEFSLQYRRLEKYDQFLNYYRNADEKDIEIYEIMAEFSIGDDFKKLLKDYRNHSLTPLEEKELKRILKRIQVTKKAKDIVERKLKEIAKNHEISFNPFNIDHFRNELLLKKTFEHLKELKEFIKERERNLLLRLGNYTNPHEVLLQGVPVSMDTAEVLILTPQEIEIRHSEHGKNTFYIPKPTYARFRTL